MTQTYKLKYGFKFETGDFTKAELGADGGADALVVASIVRPPDGSLSLAFLSKEGSTGEEVSDSELFKVWALLAARLLESDIDGGRRKILEAAHESVRKMVTARARI